MLQDMIGLNPKWNIMTLCPLSPQKKINYLSFSHVVGNQELEMLLSSIIELLYK